MLAQAKNFDAICFQFWSHYPELDNPLKKDVDRFSKNIRTILSSGKKIKPQLDASLSNIFGFRIKAIKWLVENHEIDLTNIFNELGEQIETFDENPQLKVLAENILFALRCNYKVVQAMVEAESLSGELMTPSVVETPIITYEQFVSSIALGVPDDGIAQKLLDWTNASLYIEFILITTFIINNEKLNIPNKIINELAFLVANAAQEYSAIAMELGILKPQSIPRIESHKSSDKQFLKEQKELADLGLNNFNAAFD